MINNEKIVQAVLDAIDELNEQLPKDEKLKKSVDVVLFGSGGDLDSLRLVSLITTLEQKIEEQFSASINIFDNLASSENDNPFMTVNSLAEFIASILEKHSIE